MSALIYLDTETTCKDECSRACQIAFIAETAQKRFLIQSLCKPPQPIDYFAMAIHHITNEMVENAPKFLDCETVKTLREFNAEDSVLIAHNAPFDLDVLQREGFMWRGQVLDTYRAARSILSDLPSHALQYLRYALNLYKDERELAADLGLENLAAHDAAGDITVLYLLTQYLLKKTGGIIELLRIANEPVLIKTFRFGKYKGKDLSDVAKFDRGYLIWLREEKIKDAKGSQSDADLIYAIDRALENKS